jgi:hypothetical protein
VAARRQGKAGDAQDDHERDGEVRGLTRRRGEEPGDDDQRQTRGDPRAVVQPGARGCFDEQPRPERQGAQDDREEEPGNDQGHPESPAPGAASRWAAT